jgi:hypothetical protein
MPRALPATDYGNRRVVSMPAFHISFVGRFQSILLRSPGDDPRERERLPAQRSEVTLATSMHPMCALVGAMSRNVMCDTGYTTRFGDDDVNTSQLLSG